jgi:hypothetical protein
MSIAYTYLHIRGHIRVRMNSVSGCSNFKVFIHTCMDLKKVSLAKTTSMDFDGIQCVDG